MGAVEMSFSSSEVNAAEGRGVDERADSAAIASVLAGEVWWRRW